LLNLSHFDAVTTVTSPRDHMPFGESRFSSGLCGERLNQNTRQGSCSLSRFDHCPTSLAKNRHYTS